MWGKNHNTFGNLHVSNIICAVLKVQAFWNSVQRAWVIWSWINSKLNKFEVEEICSLRSLKLKIYKEVQRWSLNLQFKFGLKVEVKLEVSIRSLKLKIKVEVWSCIWILSEYLKLKFEVDIDNLKKFVVYILSWYLIDIKSC